jgi:hypothetical protein
MALAYRLSEDSAAAGAANEKSEAADEALAR